MSEIENAWREIKLSSFTFSNEARAELAAKWRKYISLLPPEIPQRRRFHLMEAGIDLSLAEIPDAIERDPNVAFQLAQFFSR